MSLIKICSDKLTSNSKSTHIDKMAQVASKQVLEYLKMMEKYNELTTCPGKKN